MEVLVMNAPRSALGFTLSCALALCLLVPASRSRAAGLLIADGGFGGALEIKEHSARVTVNNGVAVTEVTQVFQNTENRPVEALYTFPVPRGASVAGFSMWINGKEMVGEVLEKERARQIYQSYKQSKKDPGLLEQTDYRTFEMRVFPIAPRAEQKVQITYYQELDFDHDWATYVYPLATQTRPGINSRTTGKFAFTADVKSEIPILEMASPSHQSDLAVAKHTEGYWQASLETRSGDLSRDLVLHYHVSRPHTGIDVISSRAGSDEDGYFALTLTAGEELAAMNKNGMDYVFVLDVSGSMGDDGKLSMSQKSLGAFITALGEADRFEVMTFNSQPKPLFRALRNADAKAKAEADEYLSKQNPRGGTAMDAALVTAYKYAEKDRALNVVVLSDGLTDQTERVGLSQLIKQRPQGSRVFAVGVGNDVNRPMLEQIANDSGGLAAFISRGDDFERQAQAFRRKLVRPVATELSIKFDGKSGVYDLEPKQLPNLYYGLPVRLYGRYKHGGGETKVVVHAKVGDQPLDRAMNVPLPDRDDNNPQIERMWAWHKIDRLLKESDASGSRSLAIDEVVRLGEGYSIVTEYTSFIVLENDAEYQRWQIQRKNALRFARDRQSQERLAEQLRQLRDKATASLGPEAIEVAPKPPQVVQQATALPPSAATPRLDGASNHDLGWPAAPGGKGGGAVDPITALAAGALIVGGWRKRDAPESRL
jgi:Ca-activated chloride channel family protein